MHLLGSGRSAFLEFLRNLTPATLVTGIAIVLWSGLDFRRIDLSNWQVTLAFYGCASTAILAFFANISAFLDAAFSVPLGLDRAIRRLRRRGHSGGVLLHAYLVLIWRAKPVVFLEAVIAILIVYACLMVGALSALSAAATGLRNGLR